MNRRRAMSPLRRRMIEECRYESYAPKKPNKVHPPNQGGFSRAHTTGRSPDRELEDVPTLSTESAAERRARPDYHHTVARCGSFSGLRSGASDIIEHTTFHSEPGKLPGRDSDGGSVRAAGCSTWPQN